jgi:hypothetical protein
VNPSPKSKAILETLAYSFYRPVRLPAETVCPSAFIIFLLFAVRPSPTKTSSIVGHPTNDGVDPQNSRLRCSTTTQNNRDDGYQQWFSYSDF